LHVFTFHVFSNMTKTTFDPNHIRFCREFQPLSFDKKDVSVYRRIYEKYLKYKQSNLFWDTRYLLR
jgi:hypothetical protein